MRIIDLSMPLDNRTPAYPGDEKIKVEQVAVVDKDGYSKKNITCNTHCGTHIDAPIHMVTGGKNLDQFPLDQFIGEVVLIDVRKKPITLDCLKDKKITNRSVVLFLTGQSDNCYQEYYKGTKYIPENVARELVKKKIKAIGVDALSPDTTPYLIHKILLPKNILIIENLMNLKELVGKKSTIHFFPLRITQGDGSPTRAIAITK